ncbi:hypothetical protein GUITHDRAFT_107856 [Guillardia theta CCMP2712]|uniref:Uncharacterized protein n=1 Tax=Guillardia theta (strain CCMP2712) TaxID=905079 RepID=L1JCH0_GUITC|nr:hypothetical protein GUITHDRAFT_107856 [Guillardia theta CCMP2712]EKX46243.1 hypothetical protein GUITHDRAFT_107856 [Guillardia theta CCMP2712]|eukprot:XP_005833223.1 hypothetical protein GUITHDRAFT_107856 [Guillardia theta CCMP2712]
MNANDVPDEELVQRRLEESEEKLMRWKRKARALRENRDPYVEEAQENWEKVVKDEASTELKLRLWKAKAAASRKGDAWSAEQSIQEIFEEQQDMLRESSADELKTVSSEETVKYVEGRPGSLPMQEEVEAEARASETFQQVKRSERSGEGEALCLAARSGKIEAVIVLLGMGANVDGSARWGGEQGGQHCMKLRCRVMLRQIVRLLLDSGASTSVQDANRETPRDLAQRAGRADILVLLDEAREVS